MLVWVACLRHRNQAGVSFKICNTLSDLEADHSHWTTAGHLLVAGGGVERGLVCQVLTFSVAGFGGDPECPSGGEESASRGWDVRVGLGGQRVLTSHYIFP